MTTTTFELMEDVSVPVPNGEINVWHRSAGEGAATAVLVHGLSGNSRWWTSVIDHLPEDMGVVAMDLRGRGESVDAPPPYDLTTIADDIARAMDHLRVETAIVAGYSMGGWVVALFGTRQPDRIRRLVLVDGGLPIPREDEVDPESMIEALVGPSLRRLQSDFENEESFFEAWKTHPAFESYWDDSMKACLGHELVRDGERFIVRCNPEAIRVGAREIVVDEEANAAAAHLTVPTHLIVVERGTMDQPGGMIPLDVAEQTAGNNPHVTMEYLPGVNHYTLLLGAGATAVASAIATTG